MRYILTFFAFLFIFNINAQTDKNWIIGTQLGYYYNENMNDYNNSAISLATLGPYFDKSRSFSNNIYVGKKIGTSFIWGFGIEMQLIRTQKKYTEFSHSSNQSTDLRTTQNINKTNRYSPFVYLEYNKNIGNKFYFVAKSHILYDLYKFRNSSEISEIGEYLENIEEQTQQYITTSIQPAIRYDLFKSFGIELNLGRIEYSIQSMDSEENLTGIHPNRLEINFKPNNWLLGIYFRL